MKGQMDTEMGKIFVDEDVLAKYAGSAAVECFGVVGMASVNVRDGFVKLLKKDNLRHGVNVSVADGKLMIELHIIVAYEVSILAQGRRCRDECHIFSACGSARSIPQIHGWHSVRPNEGCHRCQQEVSCYSDTIRHICGMQSIHPHNS